MSDDLVRDPLPYGYPLHGTCSPEELAAYRTILRRLAAAQAWGFPESAWMAGSWKSEAEENALVALMRDRYVLSVAMGTWCVLVPSEVGLRYLAQFPPEVAP